MHDVNWKKMLFGVYSDLSNEEKLIQYKIVIGVAILSLSVLFIFPYDKLLIDSLDVNIDEGKYVVLSRLIKLLLIIISSVYYNRLGKMRSQLAAELY